ncbi:MAG: GNAT family N-acetyltransferase [Candidatus Paceibacteria bacterium]
MQSVSQTDVEYLESAEGLLAKQMEGFFVGWEKQPSSAMLQKILNASDYVAIAKDSEKMVGFATANTDGVISAYIPLIEVLPEYQGMGIGNRLMKMLLKKLEGIYMVDLLCDTDVEGFYKQLGFQKASAMMLRNYNKQKGDS